MADKHFRIEIISPAGIEVEDETSDVVMPSVNGQMGVLPLHVRYAGLLEAGEVRFVSARTGSTRTLNITGGFCTVHGDTVTLMVDGVQQ